MTKDHVNIKYLVQKTLKVILVVATIDVTWLIQINYRAVAIIILKQPRYQILVYCLSYYVKNFNLGNVNLITTWLKESPQNGLLVKMVVFIPVAESVNSRPGSRKVNSVSSPWPSGTLIYKVNLPVNLEQQYMQPTLLE